MGNRQGKQILNWRRTRTCEIVSEVSGLHPQTSSIQSNVPPAQDNEKSTAEDGQQEHPQTSSIQTNVQSQQLLSPQRVMYETSPETVNFFRVACLILDVCNGAMRDLLRSKIIGGETVLTHRIASSRQNPALRKLSNDQKNVIFPPPNKLVEYRLLDFTLMYTIARNVFHEEIEPNSTINNRWGKSPMVGDNSLLAAIERIRECRNTFFAHATSSKISENTFNKLWTTIEGAMDEMDNHIDRSISHVCYRKQMEEIKTSSTDPELRNVLKKQVETETMLNDVLENVYEMEVETDFRLNELLNLRKNYGKGLIGCRKSFRFLSQNIVEDNTFMENESSIDNDKNEPDIEEKVFEQDIFKQWEEEDSLFFPTNASRNVENMSKKKNLVIVTGHSGCGKTAIIHHIALVYRKKGWNVKPLDTIEEIKNIYTTEKFTERTLLILNDPIGKESFDEVLYNLWNRYENTFELFLKKVKLLLTCRKCILFDERVKGLLKKKENIITVDEGKNMLNHQEKRQIFKKHISNESTSIDEEDLTKIVETEIHYPLLCKMFASKKNRNHAVRFFKKPIEIMRNEINNWKVNDRKKYCGLVCLVLFNDTCCKNDMTKENHLFKTCLKLCELPDYTSPATILENLKLLKGSYIKEIGNTFHFYHDLVMEITTFVFGRDYPEEFIKYADIGFLRRTLHLGESVISDDSFIINLSEEYITNLVDRFLEEMVENRFMDVVLNPCLQNGTLTDLLIEKIKEDCKKLQAIFKKIKLIHIEEEKHTEQETISVSRKTFLSKLAFIDYFNEISPLFALIVFGHDTLSLFCLKNRGEVEADLKESNFLYAVCCNGSKELFRMFSREEVNECLKETSLNFHLVHVVSMFNNSELLEELLTYSVDVNMKSKTEEHGTPLRFAAGSPLCIACRHGHDSIVQLLLHKDAEVNLCEETGCTPLYIACYNGRESTVQLLLNYGAQVNLCEETGCSPLYIACQNKSDSIVQLLLHNGGDVNLCEETGCTPLYIACQNGYESTVQILLNNGAQVNLCKKTGESPLYTACRNKHDGIVKLLLSNGAQVDLCEKRRESPLYRACYNGLDSTVQLLLNNGAKVNACDWTGESPLYTACYNGRESTVQLLLKNGADVNLCEEAGCTPLYIACFNGHDSIVQLLLKNGADVNLYTERGCSPLYIACQNKYDSIVQLLLINGGDENLCDKDGCSPLYIACKNGSNSTVQLLLNNGDIVNLCTKTGCTPLYIACCNGHDSVAQLLMNNGAEVNLCEDTGCSPLYIACQNGHDSIIQLLLNNGAEVNLCDRTGESPLYTACQNGHDSIVQFLLNKGATLNLCTERGCSPLYIACYYGLDSTVQLLLNNGAKVNVCDCTGKSPLYTACQSGHDSTVQLLLKNDATVNLREEAGCSPLYIACDNGYDSIVQLLLKNGADVNLCTESGRSPLYIACYNSHDSVVLQSSKSGEKVKLSKTTDCSVVRQNKFNSIVQLLLINGAHVNLCDKAGSSPLYIACKNGSNSTVQLLLNNGAKVNLCTKTGCTPLYIACCNGHDSVAQLLMNKGAEVNLCTKTGVSPLHTACYDGQESTVHLLLQNGADVKICDENGRSPIDVARQMDHDSIVKLLLMNGAEMN